MKEKQTIAPPIGMRARALRSPNAKILAGACWVIYGMFLPMYRLTDYVIVTAISVAVYFIARAALPKQTIYERQRYSYTKTGERPADVLLQFGAIYITQMASYLGQLDERPKMQAMANSVILRAETILSYGHAHPQEHAKLRQTVNVYLAAAVRILDDYMQALDKGGRGEAFNERAKAVYGTLEQCLAALSLQAEQMQAPEPVNLSQQTAALKDALLAHKLMTKKEIAGLGAAVEKAMRVEQDDD